MLSRVADNLYWLSRYLERAEHTARQLDLNLHQMLDQTPEAATRRWDRLLACLSAPAPAEAPDAYAMTEQLTFDSGYPDSIVSCIATARENARQVRENISSEMWEQLNRLYLHVRGASMDDLVSGEPHAFFLAVKEGVQLFQGITDSTMGHGQGWQFIQLGRHLERAAATALLLDAHLDALLSGYPGLVLTASLDDLGRVGLLKSCTAFEAYCRTYTADLQPERILEFLLLNVEFPHSLRFSAGAMQAALQAISRASGQRHAGRAERLAGRLRSALDYSQVDELLAEDMHSYLTTIRQQCLLLHQAIYQAYITYPIGTALAG